MSSARPAATVMVFRETAGELQLLMLKRSGKAGFFPNAWVFPGGRVDAADREAKVLGAVEGLDDQSFAVAAVRECFEESGVWLGKGTPSQDLRDRLNSFQATMADAPDLVADLDRMHLWSWWITPEAEPKRYDTRFFLTCLSAEESSEATQDDRETVEVMWVNPAEAVKKHESGEMFMAPPTYLTLRELSACRTSSDLEKLCRDRDVRPIMPLHRKVDGVLEIVLPGHQLHPVADSLLETEAVRFVGGVWRLV